MKTTIVAKMAAVPAGLIGLSGLSSPAQTLTLSLNNN